MNRQQNEKQLQQLLREINCLDFSVLDVQREMVRKHSASPISEMVLTPFDHYCLKGSKQDAELGRKLIAEGKVGCLIVAGGQGTRLGFAHPKGMFPISCVKQKSLFQLISEKIVAASKQAGRSLPVALMTSQENHQEIISYFAGNRYFGLERKQIDFFSQGQLPFLNAKGDLFLEAAGEIAQGPDGNGTSLKHFFDKGLWSAWHRKGVEYLNFILIDNPLADPFDAELIGFHHRKQADTVIKCVPRGDPNENVGVVVNAGGNVAIIEYSELSLNEKSAIGSDGQLRHRCANISLFSFTLDFIRHIANQNQGKMPLHKAWKSISQTDNKVKAWKFERFIFDVLPFAGRVEALLYPREESFAPLKNVEGADGPSAVRLALQARDRSVLFELSGKMSTVEAFELDQQFYYPTPEIMNKWKGKKLPDSFSGSCYVEP